MREEVEMNVLVLAIAEGVRLTLISKIIKIAFFGTTAHMFEPKRAANLL